MPSNPPIIEPRSPLLAAQSGKGEDVVLLHGALTSSDDMKIALFASLEDEFRVTAFDRPGHGRNTAPGGGSPFTQAQQVHASVQALGLKRPVIVGHSFGGAVALAYAMRYPDETAGVVALSPIAFPEIRLEHLLLAPRAIPGPFGFWSHSLGRLTDPVLLPVLWRAMFLPQAMPAAFEAHFPFHLAGQADRVLSDAQDASLLTQGVGWNALRYGSCEAPVHIFAGDRDMVVNPTVHAEGLARRLPKSQITRLAGLGHMVHHFAQPAIVEAVRELHAGAG